MAMRSINVDLDIIMGLARARQNASRCDVSHDIEMIRRNIDALGTSPASYGTSTIELEYLELEGWESEAKRLTKLKEGGMDCQARIEDVRAKLAERRAGDTPTNVIILFPIAD